MLCLLVLQQLKVGINETIPPFALVVSCDSQVVGPFEKLQLFSLNISQ